MAVPDVDDFRERFPEFVDKTDSAVEFALADAADEISDEVWTETDYPNGVLFLAAHFLTTGSAAAEFIEEGGPAIKSESIGRLSTTYGDPASAFKYETTEYGSRYLRLRNRNVPRMLVL